MDLRTYLLALRKRWPLLLVASLLGALAGLGAYLITPPTYASQVQFYVGTPAVQGTSPQSAGEYAQSRVASYLELLTSERMARRVLATTELPLSPAEVSDRITPTTEINTVVITVTTEGESRQEALQIAQGLVTSFPDLVDELDNLGRDTRLVFINTISGPTVSSGPVSPSPVRYIAGGLLAGLLLGLAIAVLRELADNSVRSEEVAQGLVGAPVIGSIPFDSDTRRAPLIVGEEANSARAEAYRQVRTNLQFIEAARAGNVALLTSAAPGEGKTITAVNLALSFVESGDRVLLLEADLRRPQLARYLDLPGEVGLSNVLAGQADLEAVVQQWGEGGLHLLPAGSLPPNPSELLGSAQMHRLVEGAKQRFDRVILDTAPVLPVTDGVVCASVADAVILVVQHGRTPRAEVARAVRALERVNAPVVGAVLNMERERKPRWRRSALESPYDAHTSAATNAWTGTDAVRPSGSQTAEDPDGNGRAAGFGIVRSDRTGSR